MLFWILFQVDILRSHASLKLKKFTKYICTLLGIDTSLPALELAKENIVLNNMDPERISFLREDAIEFMKAALSRNESWDLVILDPPKLAPRRKVFDMHFKCFCNTK